MYMHANFYVYVYVCDAKHKHKLKLELNFVMTANCVKNFAN